MNFLHDPMDLAIDWFDAYRAEDVNELLKLYGDAIVLECGRDGQTTVAGRNALEVYWRGQFATKPAIRLEDMRPEGEEIVLLYHTRQGAMRTALTFNASGKIAASRCARA